MAELAHNVEYDVAVYWDAFGQVDGSGKSCYLNMHFTTWSDYRGEAASRCDTGEQELRIKFPHLILHRHQQCSFGIIHFLARPPSVFANLPTRHAIGKGSCRRSHVGPRSSCPSLMLFRRRWNTSPKRDFLSRTIRYLRICLSALVRGVSTR